VTDRGRRLFAAGTERRDLDAHNCLKSRKKGERIIRFSAIFLCYKLRGENNTRQNVGFPKLWGKNRLALRNTFPTLRLQSTLFCQIWT
jgi:hypothetical protein